MIDTIKVPATSEQLFEKILNVPGADMKYY